MMIRAIAFMTVWVVGCLVFDAALNLSGPWLMLGGAITQIAGGIMSDVIGSAFDRRRGDR